MSDEAKLHIDLCMEYMEIVDNALVDEVPKIFIMMLVMKTIDFLNGGITLNFNQLHPCTLILTQILQSMKEVFLTDLRYYAQSRRRQKMRRQRRRW